MKKLSLISVVAVLGLITLSSCEPSLSTGNLSRNLLNSYSWFPGVWDILGWLGCILVIIGTMYSAVAWILLVIMNLTGKQR